MKTKKRAPLLFTLLVCFALISGRSAMAQDDVASSPNGSGLSLDFRLGLNILSYFRIVGGGASDTVFGVVTGAGASYYLNKSIGFFVAFDYVQRGVKFVSGVTEEVNRTGFLDIPFGFQFRYKPTWGLAESSTVLTRLGALYSVGLGDLSRNSGTLVATPKNSFGIYVGSTTLFEVSPQFSLGPDVWAKFGLSSAFETNDSGLNNFADIGLGIAASYSL